MTIKFFLNFITHINNFLLRKKKKKNIKFKARILYLGLNSKEQVPQVDMTERVFQ